MIFPPEPAVTANVPIFRKWHHHPPECFRQKHGNHSSPNQSSSVVDPSLLNRPQMRALHSTPNAVLPVQTGVPFSTHSNSSLPSKHSPLIHSWPCSIPHPLPPQDLLLWKPCYHPASAPPLFSNCLRKMSEVLHIAWKVGLYPSCPALHRGQWAPFRLTHCGLQTGFIHLGSGMFPPPR